VRVALIANGAKLRASQEDRIQALLERAAPGSICLRTNAAGETGMLVREALKGGAQRILVAGGDGTIHEAANALIGRPAELAVLPAGSGNDYARTLGVPASLDEAVRYAIEAAARPTDAGEIVFTAADGAEGRRIFLNIAQAGFGADVVRNSRATVRIAPGWLGYQLAIFSALATLRRAQVSVSADGEPPRRIDSTNLIVGLGQFFGGGLRPLVDASLDDGLFDIAHIRDASRIDIARHAPLLKSGIPPGHPKIDRLRCRSIHASSNTTVPVEADGELLGFLPATFRVLPAALQVVRRL
jgi:diacylglycerol kinase (ATP)